MGIWWGGKGARGSRGSCEDGGEGAREKGGSERDERRGG